MDITAHRGNTTAGLRIGERGSSVRDQLRFAGWSSVVGKDDMKLDQFGGRDDTWLARRRLELQEIMLDHEVRVALRLAVAPSYFRDETPQHLG